MSDLIGKANKIIYLVDTHGEIVDCKVKKCGTCRLIKELRDEIGKDCSKMKYCGRRKTYIYTIWKGEKIVSHHDTMLEVSLAIGCSKSGIRYMLENELSKNGLTVTRELNELEEN